jgi:inorganic phosphate transporter, PiT family
MLHFPPASTEALIALVICFVLVCAFEFANGFHDTANAVATVIYTHSLRPRAAVAWSAFMNFLGVLLGGIAVAYALVELLPPDVLSPPNGAPAVPMLVALFSTALAWNVFTWFFGIPNSSSHCVIGSLIGIAVGDAVLNARRVSQAVDWDQIWSVLSALAISPVLGLVGAGLLYFALRHLVKDRRLYEPPHDDTPPTWWIRGLLILTCTSVSFSHGTNDGQKSIGLIMLTIIGLMPAAFALNPNGQIQQLAAQARSATPLIDKYGDDQKQVALDSAHQLQARQQSSTPGVQKASHAALIIRVAEAPPMQGQSPNMATPSSTRNDVYRVVSELRAVAANPGATKDDKEQAARIQSAMRPTVEYAPWWVRVLSAVCLGLGTGIGYKRIVQTLGERVGKTHLTPAQGASAELVGAGLIATAGFTGLPVSTTHVITSGIAGTMLGSRSGVDGRMLTRIALAWAFTLPVTILASAMLFYVLES